MMDPFCIMDTQPGILYADERRYHCNGASLGLTFPYPPAILFKQRMYIASSSTTNKDGDFLDITYTSEDGYAFVVHDKTKKKEKL